MVAEPVIELYSVSGKTEFPAYGGRGRLAGKRVSYLVAETDGCWWVHSFDPDVNAGRANAESEFRAQLNDPTWVAAQKAAPSKTRVVGID